MGGIGTGIAWWAEKGGMVARRKMDGGWVGGGRIRLWAIVVRCGVLWVVGKVRMAGTGESGKNAILATYYHHVPPRTTTPHHTNHAICAKGAKAQYDRG